MLSLLAQPGQTSAAQPAGRLPVDRLPADSLPALSQQQILAKIDPWVLQTAAAGETEFLVFLTEQADLSAAAALPTKLAKGQYVYQTLTETAQRTQGALLQVLEEAGAVYQPYWVTNMIWVQGGQTLINTLAGRADVAHLYANPSVKADLGSTAPTLTDAQVIEAVQAVEWNISLVNAPQVWNAGFKGQGVVVGGQDTGYDWDHPALINQYRGSSGATVDHNYNWYDAIHEVDPHNSGTNPCGLDALAPCDDHGHGTHTMGTMAGDDGAGNQIGMAPKAQWIGCRNMERGWGKPSTYAACYQWFIAPTTLYPNDRQPDPSKAPDIINNSWGCPTNEGCTDPNVLLSVVNSVTAAGILTVHSAGNEGWLNGSNQLTCSTVQTPAGIYAASFTVGNTDVSDTLNPSSSIGPVSADGSSRMKPNIAAPGTSIRSSAPGTGYRTLTGTSMSAPHVVGLAALLISARPDLAGQVDELRQIIERSAVTAVKIPGQPTTCGGTSPTQIPNNFFGWGRIDAEKALQTALTRFTLEASQTTPAAGELITITLAITNSHPLNALTGVSINASLTEDWVGVRSSHAYSQTGSSFAWDLGQVNPNTSTRVTISGYAGLCANSANILSAQMSSSQTPLSTAAGPQLNFSGLTLTSQGPASALAGSTITYTLGVTNAQNGAVISSLALSSTLPAGLQFIQATPAYTTAQTTIFWQIPALAGGAAWHGQVAAKILSSAANPLVNQGAELALAGLPACRAQPVVTQLIWKDFLPILVR